MKPNSNERLKKVTRVVSSLAMKCVAMTFRLTLVFAAVAMAPSLCAQHGKQPETPAAGKQPAPFAAPMSMTQPAARPVEGLPIGNGRLGTLVWTTPGTVEFQINRVDVFAVNRQAVVANFPGPTDYGGGCARVSIAVGGAPFSAGANFAQRLSLADARCEVRGEAVRAVCWVADEDALVVEVIDDRESPTPIKVKLAMWREPEVRNGGHTAASVWRQGTSHVAVVQTFREEQHFCDSAVTVSSPGSEAQLLVGDAKSRILRLPAKRGTRTVLISSAATMEAHSDVGVAAERILTALAAPEALAAAAARHAAWWRHFWERTYVRIKSPDGRGELREAFARESTSPDPALARDRV